MTPPEPKYSGTPLTELERMELRGMIEDHRRAKWLWGSMHRLVIALGAVAAAVVAIKTMIGHFIK